MDIVVTLGWDTDYTDIDLHIKEPDGTHVYYGNRDSEKGGYLSRDFVNGYGPECYIIKEAELGVYEFKTRYFASHQVSKETGATSAVVWNVKNFGDYDNEEIGFNMIRLDCIGTRDSQLYVCAIDTCSGCYVNF